MKIKVNRVSRHGKKINAPYIGDVEVPEDGILEVEKKHGEKLLNECPKSFSEVETGKKKTTPKKEEAEVEDEFTHLSLEELIDIAKMSKIKGWQPLAKKPKMLKKFLRKKLKKAEQV